VRHGSPLFLKFGLIDAISTGCINAIFLAKTTVWTLLSGYECRFHLSFDDEQL
jgi:hypothetical protein